MDVESALIVPVPAAGQVVDHWRRRLDPSAALGVPAHVTVMYPYVEPTRIDDESIGRMRTIFASAPEFGFRLESIGWFRPRVLWLAPVPSTPFKSLTDMVADEWPELAPYDGAYDEVIPHLTVGESDDSEALMVAARRIEAVLPISCMAEEVMLIGRSGGSPWHTITRLPLGTAG